jgi:hypothetical protein
MEMVVPAGVVVVVDVLEVDGEVPAGVFPVTGAGAAFPPNAGSAAGDGVVRSDPTTSADEW